MSLSGNRGKLECFCSFDRNNKKGRVGRAGREENQTPERGGVQNVDEKIGLEWKDKWLSRVPGVNITKFKRFDII